MSVVPVQIKIRAQRGALLPRTATPGSGAIATSRRSGQVPAGAVSSQAAGALRPAAWEKKKALHGGVRRRV